MRRWMGSSTRRWLWQPLVILVLGPMLVWSGPGWPAPRASIRVGVPLPLTGRHAPFGEIIKNSFQLAAEEVNNAGGVRGSRLELVFEDSRSDVQTARTITEKLINQDKVVMLTGQYSSAETFPTAQIAQQYGIPFLVSTAAADEITKQGWKYIFRMCQPSSEFDNGLKNFFEKVVKPSTMAILYENTLFGTSTAAAMRDWAQKTHVRVVMYEAYDAGSPDFKPLLLRVKQHGADVVYMVSYLTDAILLMRQSKEVDLNPKVFAGAAAGFSILPFIEGAGDAAEYVVSSSMWEPSVPYPGARGYYNKYVRRFGRPPSYHGAQGYAAVYVVADVLNRAGGLSPDDIVRSLAETNLMTAYGRVRFLNYGGFYNQARLPTFVIQVQKRKFVTIWPRGVAVAQPVYPVLPWHQR
jgi:branched-chain amino acid transport system substrate-binding protein